MSSERPEEFSDSSMTRGDSPMSRGRAETTVVVHGETMGEQSPKPAPKESPPQPQQATVVVRGETVSSEQTKSADSKSTDSKPREESSSSGKGKEKTPQKELSQAKVRMQSRLPALDDDPDVGVQKELLVTRDGKADLTFTGTLLASAAPASAPQGSWKEYRIYETSGGKHVFAKTSRSVEAGKQDTHEAEVFDPAPSSVQSKLLKSARELTHARPLTWTDAAVAFFGYDPLAKVLYRKLGGQFDEHIS